MTENESKRNAEMRINERDRNAIKHCRDRCFGSSVPMGLVCRLACEEMVENRKAASNIKL